MWNRNGHQTVIQVNDQNKKNMSHPPIEPDGDAVSTFSVRGGEHTSVQIILPSATFPTSDGAYLDFCAPTLRKHAPWPYKWSRQWRDWHPVLSLWPYIRTDLLPGSISVTLASAFLSISHRGHDVSINSPDVGGMLQNSAAHLSVSPRGSHRACSACRKGRKQQRWQASFWDFCYFLKCYSHKK